jgi:hypothetical protein
MKGFMEFDHATNRYLYPHRYIKMIPYYLYLHLWSITIPDLKRQREKSDKMLKFNSLSPRASILWRNKCIYEVIDTFARHSVM